ncbi:unnamed protein product [Prorocentrum cordatum]|uniref:Uncharacterized protein n=1 Tax=Prorocentrum cordatum TaxID=2364126 RepID=A0ABN9QPH3_9DINO|nr:unnamed protein product [Polarella glacialis]
MAWGEDPQSHSSLLELSSAKSSDEIRDDQIGPPESAWYWWAAELDSDDELGILVELSGPDLNEDEVNETLAQMGKGHQNTWKENRGLNNDENLTGSSWITLLGEDALRELRGQCFERNDEGISNQKILSIIALEGG